VENKKTWTYLDLSDAMVREGFEDYTWQKAKSEISRLQITKKTDKTKHPVIITIDLERAVERANKRGLKDLKPQSENDVKDITKSKNSNLEQFKSTLI
jgi:hypothetical protein